VCARQRHAKAMHLEGGYDYDTHGSGISELGKGRAGQAVNGNKKSYDLEVFG
jgi:hypothetical protein